MEWQMIVQDTGIGIPTERLPDIFEPFRRGSDYATRNHQGAGLGLSIVKNLVTLMEGQIEAQSTVGQGSVFTVTFPLKKANS
jgi:signal transduction histidine kinase